MVRKIILLALISLIYSEKKSVLVEYLDDYSNIDIINDKGNHNNYLVCIRIHEGTEKGDTFYFSTSCEESGKNMDKNLYLKYLTESCRSYKNYDVDLNQPDIEFNYKQEKLSIDGEDKGFVREFKFVKQSIDSNYKYMLVLVRNFTGNKMKFSYFPISAMTIVIIVIVVIVVVLIIIIALIIVCCCCCCKKRSQKIHQQYQSSYVQEPIIPEENVINSVPM